MKTLYLLPFNEQNVQFSFDKSVLEQSLVVEKGLPYQGILEVAIDDALVEKLQNPPVIEHTYPYDIPTRYYDSVVDYLKHPPEWFSQEGMRIYIIFSKDKHCFWSPSGNNLNSFYKHNPNDYLGEAIRVELTEESYVKLYGYFEWACDNF